MKKKKKTWISRLFYKENIFTKLVKAILKIEDLKSFIDSKPSSPPRLDNDFYKELFSTWFSFYSREPTHPSQILCEPLWNNKFIKAGNKELNNLKFKRYGILKVSSLFNDTGTFKTTQELEQLHNTTLDIMSLNSIKSSIPRKWLKGITTASVLQFNKTKPNILLNNTKTLKELKDCRCKFFYEYFTATKLDNPTSCLKWETIFPDLDFNWSEIFHMPYKVARETYLQSFHFKIINRYIACRANLHKWKKAPSPDCLDCGAFDSVEHHLYTCNRLQHFWQSIFTWLYRVSGLRINLTVSDIIFGICNENNDNMLNMFNYCILLAKDFIYNCKVNMKTLNFNEYRNKLMFRIEIEKHLAIVNNELEEFQRTWENFLNM